ncbi:hypothetical protein ANN_26505 [Periplaneta americana]|uniref:Uncharacterized protein n=1 Tax=Periplaneta americana TaxID=6978 RepID=A0ABQ8RYJ3_PERAM|nr:hypothetical protein ANN_26505 [Periplaneta americana]
MVGYVAPVRAVPGRSRDGTRYRRCLSETETLPHILGFCPYSEVLRNIRHHAVCSMLAEALKDNNSAYILDPTIRFETHADQPHEVDSEKKRIYEPTIPFYKDKYSLSHIDVIGLMVGARENHNLSHTELVCTRSWLLDGCQPTLRSVDIEGKLDQCRVEFPGSSVGRALSLLLAGNEFQSLGRAIVKEDEYEEVRWDGIVSIVSWRERVFRLWWEERTLGLDNHDVWFQQDGAIAHIAGISIESAQIPVSWKTDLVTRECCLAARSPDFAPNDFFFGSP